MINLINITATCMLFIFSLYSFYFVKHITHSVSRPYSKVLYLVASVLNACILSGVGTLRISTAWIYIVHFFLLFTEFSLMFSANKLVLFSSAAAFVFHILSARAIAASLISLCFDVGLYATQKDVFFRMLSLTLALIFTLFIFNTYKNKWPQSSVEILYDSAHHLKLNCAIESVLMSYQILCALSYDFFTDEKWFIVFHLSSAMLGIIWHYILVDNTVNYSVWLNQSFKADILNEQINRQLTHYEAYEKHFEGFSQFRLEYDRLIGDVRHNIQAGNVDAAQELLRLADENVQRLDSGHKRFSTNMLVDSILWDTACAAKAKDIEFEAQVTLPEWLQLSELEYCRVFANLCANALEASEKSESSRYITFKSYISGPWLTIVQENTFVSEVVVSDGRVLTNKQDKERHGMGISSIRAILEQHGGFGEISIDNDTKTFKFIIHLCKPNTSA